MRDRRYPAARLWESDALLSKSRQRNGAPSRRDARSSSTKSRYNLDCTSVRAAWLRSPQAVSAETDEQTPVRASHPSGLDSEAVKRQYIRQSVSARHTRTWLSLGSDPVNA